MIKADEAMFAEDLARSETSNLAYLLGAAVVLDSYFFKEELRAKKWTDEDTEAHNWLMQFADVGHDFWSVLNHEKFDVSAGLALGLNGIFIRDFKQYVLQSGVMGVSVSTGTIETMINHFGADAFGAACREYILKRNLGLFVIIAI
jgi:inorganic pyrophosphatase/exopolyphosphatase